jgi:hypothetical protein
LFHNIKLKRKGMGEERRGGISFYKNTTILLLFKMGCESLPFNFSSIPPPPLPSLLCGVSGALC